MLRSLAALSIATLSLTAFAAPAPENILRPKNDLPKAPAKFEFTGKLETGIMAIGGETTGTTITSDKDAYELDLHGDAKLTKAADALNGKQATVTGTLTIKDGVEIGKRKIIKVETIVAAK